MTMEHGCIFLTWLTRRTLIPELHKDVVYNMIKLCIYSYTINELLDFIATNVFCYTLVLLLMAFIFNDISSYICMHTYSILLTSLMTP